MAQVADGMEFLGMNRLVHCNLSLSNVWVGTTNIAKVIDWL
jgi:RIO-like serine/threonine protein kinase